MPTTARFIAALCLAVLAWVVSEQIKPFFDEDKAFENFNLINLAFAVAIGWQVIGLRAGRGLSAAINNGLTGGVVLLFWCLLAHPTIRMFEILMQGHYGGAFEAFSSIYEMMVENWILIATPLIIGTLVIGSVASGVFAEMTNKRAS